MADRRAKQKGASPAPAPKPAKVKLTPEERRQARIEKMLQNRDLDPASRARASRDSKEAEFATQILRSSIEALAKADAQIGAINARKAAVYANAKARLLDPAILREAYRRWRMDPQILDYRDDLTDAYWNLLRAARADETVSREAAE
jgi:uncharacterized protein (UPF0335 family)